MSNSGNNTYIKYKNKYHQNGGNFNESIDNKFLNDLFGSDSYTENDMIGGNDSFLNELFSEESNDMIGGNDNFLNRLFSEESNDMIGGNDNFLNELFNDNVMVGGEVSEGNFFNDLFTESELNDEQNGGGWFDSWFGINGKKDDVSIPEITDIVAKNLDNELDSYLNSYRGLGEGIANRIKVETEILNQNLNKYPEDVKLTFDDIENEILPIVYYKLSVSDRDKLVKNIINTGDKKSIEKLRKLKTNIEIRQKPLTVDKKEQKKFIDKSYELSNNNKIMNNINKNSNILKQNFNTNIKNLSSDIDKGVSKVSKIFNQEIKNITGNNRSPKSPKIINSDVKSDMIGGMLSGDDFINQLFN